MRDDAVAIVAEARALIGTPFRLQGRDASGLDCVGLVAAVYGRSSVAPNNYPLRGTDIESAEAYLDQHFRRRRGDPEQGDVLLLTPGPAQLHIGIWTGTSLVHAHAGLRRVVETPGAPAFPLLGIWYRETN